MFIIFYARTSPWDGIHTRDTVLPEAVIVLIWYLTDVRANRHGWLARWRKWIACDVREAKGGFDFTYVKFILQPFRRFTYVTAHSPTFASLHLRQIHSPILPSLYLRHSSFSNPSVASPTSQLILQPFRCFTYVTVHSPTLLSLHLRHSSFSITSFASTTSPGEPPLQSSWLYMMVRKTKLYFLTANEVTDDMNWMNGIMEWHEVGGFKIGVEVG